MKSSLCTSRNQILKAFVTSRGILSLNPSWSSRRLPANTLMTPASVATVIRQIVSNTNASCTPTSRTPVTSCWKCEAQVQIPLSNFPASCHKCGKLQKYAKEQLPDYFTLLGQEQHDFHVDQNSLSLNMKKLQRQLHPDLFGGKDKEEQESSQELSSFVNSAIFTLQNPIKRALYLLNLRGISIDLEKQQTLDPAFLSEVMDLNEELASLSTSEQWIEFRSRNKKVLNVLEEDLGKAFEKNDLQGAQLLLFKMKYYENLGLKLKEVQNKFNVVD